MVNDDLPGTQLMNRWCVECGKFLIIRVYENRSFDGGHHFPDLAGDNVLGEYWLCPTCYEAKTGEPSDKKPGEGYR